MDKTISGRKFGGATFALCLPIAWHNLSFLISQLLPDPLQTSGLAANLTMATASYCLFLRSTPITCGTPFFYFASSISQMGKQKGDEVLELKHNFGNHRNFLLAQIGVWFYFPFLASSIYPPLNAFCSYDDFATLAFVLVSFLFSFLFFSFSFFLFFFFFFWLVESYPLFARTTCLWFCPNTLQLFDLLLLI